MRNLSTIEVVIPLIWFLMVLPAEIYRNYYIIVKKRRRPNYAKSTILRIVVGGVLILPIYLLEGVWVELAWLMLATFAVFFDPSLNKARGLPLTYINTKKPGWWDWTLNKLGGLYQLYLFGEVLFLMVAIQTYLIGWDAFIAQVNGTYNWNNYLW
jgi:hypothetical protein